MLVHKRKWSRVQQHYLYRVGVAKLEEKENEGATLESGGDKPRGRSQNNEQFVPGRLTQEEGQEKEEEEEQTRRKLLRQPEITTVATATDTSLHNQGHLGTVVPRNKVHTVYQEINVPYPVVYLMLWSI